MVHHSWRGEDGEPPRQIWRKSIDRDRVMVGEYGIGKAFISR